LLRPLRSAWNGWQNQIGFRIDFPVHCADNLIVAENTLPSA
jgi:hypothetical protein